jgi:hypothetical protein
VSTGAEIAAFVAATVGFAVILTLTWTAWRAFAPMMDGWTYDVLLVGGLLPIALAISGARDPAGIR